jgi:hypothetical protein
MALAVFACAFVLAVTKSFIPSISGSRSIAARIARIISRASISFVLALFSLDARLAASARSSRDAASLLPNAFVLPNRLAFDAAARDDDDDDEDDGGGDNRSIARRRSSSLANRGFDSLSPPSFDSTRATTAPRRPRPTRPTRRATADVDTDGETDARAALSVGTARVHRAMSMRRALE